MYHIRLNICELYAFIMYCNPTLFQILYQLSNNIYPYMILLPSTQQSLLVYIILCHNMFRPSIGHLQVFLTKIHTIMQNCNTYTFLHFIKLCVIHTNKDCYVDGIRIIYDQIYATGCKQ
jgi:ABC-type long-subunit fatty acid transport system fused permease/ATPase subunit